jgi:hypothetical protein
VRDGLPPDADEVMPPERLPLGEILRLIRDLRNHRMTAGWAMRLSAAIAMERLLQDNVAGKGQLL